MTEKDQYYKNEDNQPETPQTIVENYAIQAAALDGMVEATVEQLKDAEGNLGFIYQKAEASGDEETKLAVNNVWQIAQDMSTRIIQADAARKASVAMMKQIGEYHGKMEKMYDELEGAVNDMDYSHPMIARLVDEVEQSTAESIYETESMWMNDEALEIAYEEVFTEMHEALHEITGTPNDDWQSVYELRELLMGQRSNVTPEQKRLLSELLETVRVKRQAKTS